MGHLSNTRSRGTRAHMSGLLVGKCLCCCSCCATHILALAPCNTEAVIVGLECHWYPPDLFVAATACGCGGVRGQRLLHSAPLDVVVLPGTHAWLAAAWDFWMVRGVLRCCRFVRSSQVTEARSST